MQWVYCWKVCLCFALHVEVQVYDGTPLKCIVCCTAVKVKNTPTPIFFYCNQSGNWCFSTSCSTWWCVISDFPALDCIFFCWAWHWSWCLAASSPLEQCRCWPGLPVSGAPVTASLTAGSSTYPHHWYWTPHPFLQIPACQKMNAMCELGFFRYFKCGW